MTGWAIAGTGAIARAFAADMAGSRHGRIVAVASADPARARALAHAIGPDVASGDLTAVLRLGAVDAVYVAGANETHAEIALAALAAGKPVLVEKPFATSVADAERVADAARASGLLAMEAMWMRFTPGIVRMRDLVASGAVGRPLRLEASLSFASHGTNVDPLLDLGVYPLSLALHLLGPASGIVALRNGTGDSVSSRHGSATLVAHVGFSGEGPNRAVLVGETGILSTDAPFFCPSHLTLRRTAAAGAAPRAEPGDPLPLRGRAGALRQALRPLKDRRYPTPFRAGGLQYQAEHFAGLLAFRLTESPVMPLADSVATLRLVVAGVQCAREKVERGL